MPRLHDAHRNDGNGAGNGRAGGGGGEDAVNGGRGADEDAQANWGQRGSGDDDGDGGGDVDAIIARMWKRRDRSKWSDELGRAFSAFERLKDYGDLEWASCVEKFLDFEKRCGYSEGSQIPVGGRPGVVKTWLAKQRRWDVTMDVGVLGAESMPDTFIHDWWKWWMTLQPKGRGNIGMLSQAATLDWSAVVRLHGRNGILQVMATLLWWGEAVVEATPLDRMTWTLAVEDVTWTLEQLLRPGVIETG
jgi:hypothetical protein